MLTYWFIKASLIRIVLSLIRILNVPYPATDKRIMFRFSLILISTHSFTLASSLVQIRTVFVRSWFLFFGSGSFSLHVAYRVTKGLYSFSLWSILSCRCLSIVMRNWLVGVTKHSASWNTFRCWRFLHRRLFFLTFIRDIIYSSFLSLSIQFRILNFWRSSLLLFFSTGDSSRNRFFKGILGFIFHNYFILVNCPKFIISIRFHFFSILVITFITNVFCC